MGLSNSQFVNNRTELMNMVLTTRANESELENIKTYLSRHPEQIDLYTKDGWTALKLAVANCGITGTSTIETVQLLLDSGANPNFRGTGYTPLMIAAKYSGTTGCYEAVELLCNNPVINIYKEIPITRFPYFGGNALTSAVYTNNPNIQVINLLVKKGVSKLDYSGIHADIIALQNAHNVHNAQ